MVEKMEKDTHLDMGMQQNSGIHKMALLSIFPLNRPEKGTAPQKYTPHPLRSFPKNGVQPGLFPQSLPARSARKPESTKVARGIPAMA